MAKNLNEIYGYKITKCVKYSSDSIKQLKKRPIKTKDCWDNRYKKVKADVKTAYYKQQKQRCAYCRKKLNADGYFNHLDHIIPKSIHHRWMFKPRNLVITCEVCNPLKNADDTLNIHHSKKRFPKKREGFTIFNPHFDNWCDYFLIEDGMFIRGKNSKGDETIRVCKLTQYNIAVQHADEANIKNSSAIRRATRRLRSFSVGSTEYEAANELIHFYIRMI
jgi:uncharacterized protein (TIGR02646 family)